jgi:hypothetical protein
MSTKVAVVGTGKKSSEVNRLNQALLSNFTLLDNMN